MYNKLVFKSYWLQSLGAGERAQRARLRILSLYDSMVYISIRLVYGYIICYSYIIIKVRENERSAHVYDCSQ